MTDGVCSKTLEHPGCVWDTKFLESGDLVTACSDRLVRSWTVNPDNSALLESLSIQISYYKISRDAVLYNLGIGACSADALDANELKYAYHPDGQQFVQVRPTFAALFSVGFFTKEPIPGLNFDYRLLLHGQQYIEIYKPLPTSAQIRNVLDLIRRGEGLRLEDVVILDQSVFAGMAGIHDRHRDMRLDVDNMSYEELLALEERTGNVSTGLSEETILKGAEEILFYCYVFTK